MNTTPYPSQLELAEFIRLFGSIYEHSPWVAEAVYPQVTPGMDPLSMASLMETIVETASDQQKLDLLRAHPDLAVCCSSSDNSVALRLSLSLTLSHNNTWRSACSTISSS